MNLLMTKNGKHCREGLPQAKSRAIQSAGRRERHPWARREMEKKKGWTVTGPATASRAEEKSVELRKSRHETAGIMKDMTAILTSTLKKRRARKLGVEITAIAIMWTSS